MKVYPPVPFAGAWWPTRTGPVLGGVRLLEDPPLRTGSGRLVDVHGLRGSNDAGLARRGGNNNGV
jgi:hypothetical protein